MPFAGKAIVFACYEAGFLSARDNRDKTNNMTEQARQGGSAATLEVEDLHKSFGDLEVLKGVSMTAHKGDVVSIVGSSGSGKSTFLRCINLLELPTSGTIRLSGEEAKFKQTRNGRVPADKKQVARLRSQLGMVFQSFNLWQHMTVIQNVMEGQVQVLKVPKPEARERAERILERVGLYDKRDQYPAFLSGGQQQRAAIARALCMEPEALLFDEPTSALDPELEQEVVRVIKDLAAEGRTMLIVTHDMKMARDVSNHVVFLHQGLIEEEGAPEKLFGAPRSERLRGFLSSTMAE